MSCPSKMLSLMLCGCIRRRGCPVMKRTSFAVRPHFIRAGDSHAQHSTVKVCPFGRTIGATKCELRRLPGYHQLPANQDVERQHHL